MLLRITGNTNTIPTGIPSCCIHFRSQIYNIDNEVILNPTIVIYSYILALAPKTSPLFIKGIISRATINGRYTKNAAKNIHLIICIYSKNKREK